MIPARRTIALQAPIDLGLTLGPLWRGPRDLTGRFERDIVWRAMRTPDGPATARLQAHGRELRIETWGARVALGDPDAVSVGDYHLPNEVAWALAGEPRGGDERMLQLIERYRGQRGRVQRLLEVGGPRAPRFGPRLALRSIARI